VDKLESWKAGIRWNSKAVTRFVVPPLSSEAGTPVHLVVPPLGVKLLHTKCVTANPPLHLYKPKVCKVDRWKAGELGGVLPALLA
jgi:hypothetical protein